MSEAVAHVIYELCNCQVDLKLVIIRWNNLHQSRTEGSYKTPFIVFNNISEVVSDEIGLKVGQVKTAVVAKLKLIHDVHYYFVRFSSSNELLSQSFAKSKHLAHNITIKSTLT